MPNSSSAAPQQDSPQELTRRLENLARLGTVAAVAHQAARCRVQIGGNTTDWLPWLAGRAGGDQGSHWWPPVAGEQCLVLAPGGDLAQGLVLPGVYSNAMAAPGQTAGVARTQWSAQDFAQYQEGEHRTHTQQAIVLAVGSNCSIALQPDRITLTAGSTVLQIGPAGISSNVDVLARGISAVQHVHGGVRTGVGQSGPPA